MQKTVEIRTKKTFLTFDFPATYNNKVFLQKGAFHLRKIIPMLLDENESIRQKKKRFHINFEDVKNPLPLGPFQLYQLGDLACSSDLVYPEHKQLCHEISLIVSGEGVFYRNGQAYPVFPNMIFFVNDQDLHTVHSSRDNPIRYFVLGFSFEENHPDSGKYLPLAQFFSTVSNPLATDEREIFSLFISALNEISSSSLYSQEMLEAYITQIIIQAYRDLSSQPQNTYQGLIEADETNPLIYEITHYIDSNLTQIKKLSDLCTVFDYSYAYLSRIFSQTIGITIKDYYTQRRFEKAARMLEQNTPISAICETLQFTDVPSFYKAFKRYYHCSPRKYQQMIWENTASERALADSDPD